MQCFFFGSSIGSGFLAFVQVLERNSNFLAQNPTFWNKFQVPGRQSTKLDFEPKSWIFSQKAGFSSKKLDFLPKSWIFFQGGWTFSNPPWISSSPPGIWVSHLAFMPEKLDHFAALLKTSRHHLK